MTTESQYSLFDPPKSIKLSQAARALAMLQVSPCTTRELLTVGLRPAAYIRQLRLMGYLIESEIVDSMATYSLVGKVERVEVTESMQAHYYETPHWRAKRADRLRFDRFRCATCQAVNELQVHHWKYDLFNESIDDLLTLCGTCHLHIHSYENVHCHFPRYVSREIAEQLYDDSGFAEVSR